ncbi:MAG: prolyl oligopeptidase family serine peptidase [Tannerella sp.]|jgi:dipeptidyl aminopeptidase/acylaminoacyl peptidase|nr:prolyl oligopeptidase family serine peptidase [Tannerella sp.]
MKTLKTLVLIGIVAATWPVVAQQTPGAMTVDDLVAWKRITAKAISDDGNWVSVRMEPWKGDAAVYVYNRRGEERASFAPAKESAFSATHYLLVTKTAPVEEIEELKLKKTKPNEMPMDRLVIYDLQSGKEEEIDSLASYRLSESADYVAYQSGRSRDSVLHVRSLDGTQTADFRMAGAYLFSKKNNVLYFVTKDTVDLKPGLYAYRPGKDATPQALLEGDGMFRQLASDEEGAHFAFLYSAGKDAGDKDKDFALYLSEGNRPAKAVAGRTDSFVPGGWIISENGSTRFSKNAARLFFGIAPEPGEKDTTQLAENRPDVHVWTWNEGIQYTVQDYNRAADLKKTYTVAYNLDGGKAVVLTSPEITSFQVAADDAATTALLSTSKPYEIERMWEGSSREDVSLIDLTTGETRPVKNGLNARVRISPKGKYAFWYSPQDSSWFTWSVAEGREYRLTTPAGFTAWDEDHDTPSLPPAYGTAGWTEDDEYILIYDRFDIWRFSPRAASAPVNLTKTGREMQTSFRYAALDRDEIAIDLRRPRLLTAFNRVTKGYAYCMADLSKSAAPKVLTAGDFMLTAPVKAKDADVLIYTEESYETYPDVHLSDLSFRHPVQLTHGGRQQDAFIWGTAELTSWTSLDGRQLEGVIYKPANFDATKKYPVIVNFYERNADTYHSYHMPEPHRSTVDYHFYNSNGYIVFNPDIVYDDGYPGESCYRAVMSGVTTLIARGYVNEKAIGAQGHSWGGYQDAYLATRTNLFAAIESGAPVVNMFSAYGGIRWGSGLNRSFQYEHGQSRIGKSIWESPLRYIENSPLFDMDRVQTPILIMANDKDGHVPWYQGIEFFIALRRLQKPAWLLNYTGEPHWPMRMANRVDFQKRMFQFFEHYLCGKPAPRWMSEGVPAVEREFELGY